MDIDKVHRINNATIFLLPLIPLNKGDNPGLYAGNKLKYVFVIFDFVCVFSVTLEN